MGIPEWNKHVDYILNDATLKWSTTNKVNRNKQKYPSSHGSQSYAQLRHKAQDPVTGQFSNLIDQFGNTHRRNNEYVNPIAQREHQQMEQLRESQAGSLNPMTNEQILSQVLGERRGHNHGRSIKLPVVAYIPTYKPPKERFIHKLRWMK